MKNERTLKLMENYPRHFFDEGMEPKEIAKMYNLSSTTMYNVLNEVASKLGISREELLKRPHDEHIMGARNFEPVKKVDVSGFRSSMEEFDKNMIAINGIMAQAIDEHEDYQNLYEEVDR